MNQKKEKGEPKTENQMKKNDNNQNMKKLTIYKEYDKPNLYDNNKIIIKNSFSKKDSKISKDNESIISKKCIYDNFTTMKNISPNSIFTRVPNNISFKQTINSSFSTFSSLPPLNTFNYYLYNSQCFNNNLFSK